MAARKFDFLRCDLCGNRDSTPGHPGSHPGKRVCGWCWRETVTDEELLKHRRRGFKKDGSTASPFGAISHFHHEFCGAMWGGGGGWNRRRCHQCEGEIARRFIVGLLYASGASIIVIRKNRNTREDHDAMYDARGELRPEYRTRLNPR